MLYTGFLGQARNMAEINNPIKLLAVRKPPEVIPEGFIHVPQLSPSLELFFKTKKWKKGEFQTEDIFLLDELYSGEENNNWWFLYRRLFIKEMNQRDDMKRALTRLEYLLTEDKSIYLFCYCPNEELCHRSLIAEYFLDKGFTVKKIPNYNSQLSLF